MKIRKMQLGDHISIHKNIFTEMPLEIIENNVINNVNSMNQGTNWVYFVAEINNEVVGTMYLEIKEKSFERHIGELYSIVIAEEYRGQGICRELLLYVINYAKEHNLKKLILSVRTGTPSEIVYQKIGFTKYGQLPEAIIENNKCFDKSYYYINID